MKKKLIIVVLVLCLAVSVVALAACNKNDDDRCTCTLAGDWMPGVFCVRFVDTSDGGIYADLSQELTEATRLPKGPIGVRVELQPGAIIENLQVYINGRSMPLGTLHEDEMYYQFTYEITGNFDLSFGGESVAYRLSLQLLRNGEAFEGDVVNAAEDGEDHYEVVATVEGILEGGISDCLFFGSDNPEVADVEPYESGEDFVTFAVIIGTAGTTHITFHTPTNSKTITVVVAPMAPVQVDSLSLSATQMRLYNGWENFDSSFDAEFTCDDERGAWRACKVEVGDQSVIDVESHVDYYNPDEHTGWLVVSVTPKSAGTSVITVTAGDKTATCTVTVEEKPTEVTGSEGLEFLQDYRGRWYVSGWGSCDDENVVIPNVHNGERVYYVSMSNTTGLKTARNIVVSEGIVELSNAFRGCSNVTSITLPDSLTVINNYSFRECESLTEIDIPEGVTKIGDHAFYDCRKLESVIIPDSVTEIGSEAFQYCTSLTEITLPENLESLSSQVFLGCSKLQNIEIPQSVKEIGIEAFAFCDNLTEIHLPEGLTEIPDGLFSNCTSLNNVNIPESVTAIGENAFRGCGFTELSFSDDVEYADGAFYGARVQKIIFKDMADLLAHWNVFVDYDYNNADMSDGYKIYLGTDLLEGEITVSATVPCAFLKGYLGITKVTFDGVEVISQNAFADCEDLEEIVLGDVQRIESDAFYDCNGLTIYLSAPVTLDEHSFLQQAVTDYEIHFDDLKVWLGSDGLIVWNGAKLYLQETLLDGTVTIPSDVTKVPDCAFFGNNDITEFVLEDGVEEIGAQAFSDCSVLTTITLPDSITSIASDALDDCRELTEIKCSSNVDVSGLSLYGCTNFKGTLSEDGRYYVFGGKIRSLVAGLTYFVVPENLQFDDHAFDSVQYTLKYIYVPENANIGNVNIGNCNLIAILSEGPSANLPSSNAKTIADLTTKCTDDGWVHTPSSDYPLHTEIEYYIGDVDQDGNVTVPAKIENWNVTDMGQSSNYLPLFAENDAIRKITFNSTNITLTSNVLCDLPNLEEIVLSGSVQKWLVMAPKQTVDLSGCPELTKISVEEGYTYQVNRINKVGNDPQDESLGKVDILQALKDSPTNCYTFVVTVSLDSHVDEPIDTVVGQTFVCKDVTSSIINFPIDDVKTALQGKELTFGSDGNGTIYLYSGNGATLVDFTYEVKAQNVQMKVTAQGQSLTLTATIEGSLLKLTYRGTYTMIFVLK